jgi:hypothetical protein
MLVANRNFQPMLQFIDAVSECARRGKQRWHFADVTRALVHGLEQALQPVAEDRVTLAAAKTSGFLKVGLGEAAGHAFALLRAAVQLFLRAKSEQKICKRESGRIRDTFLFSAAFAQVYLLHLTISNLGQIHSGALVFTNITNHFNDTLRQKIPLARRNLGEFYRSTCKRGLMVAEISAVENQLPAIAWIILRHEAGVFYWRESVLLQFLWL